MRTNTTIPEGYAENAVLAVATAAGVPELQFAWAKKGERRSRETIARWILFRLLQQRGVTLSAIGRKFGFDHTSVMYALRALAKMRENNRDIRTIEEAADKAMSSLTNQTLEQRLQTVRNERERQAAAEVEAAIDKQRLREIEKEIVPLAALDWYAEQHKRFVKHMREAHPEIEWKAMGAR